MNKMTQGPWEISKIASHEPQFDVYSEKNDGSVAIVRSTKDENAKANAQAIAAVPGLIEACYSALDDLERLALALGWSESNDHRMQTIECLMDVIAKAEGR